MDAFALVLKFDSIFAVETRYSKLAPVALAAFLIEFAILARGINPEKMLDVSIAIAAPLPGHQFEGAAIMLTGG